MSLAIRLLESNSGTVNVLVQDVKALTARQNQINKCMGCLANERSAYCVLGLRFCPWLLQKTTPERRATTRS